MYKKYHTEAIVLGGANVDESDRRYYLFTKELGLISAFAKSPRELRSKLRFGLQDLSHSQISLIRGKDRWKITDAALVESIYSSLSGEREKLRSISRALSLLRRLIQGEEKNEELFEIVVNGFHFLKKEQMEGQDIKNFECLTVLRILNNLGYVRENEYLTGLLTPQTELKDTISKVQGVRGEVITEINSALKASQM